MERMKALKSKRAKRQTLPVETVQTANPAADKRTKTSNQAESLRRIPSLERQKAFDEDLYDEGLKINHRPWISPGSNHAKRGEMRIPGLSLRPPKLGKSPLQQALKRDARALTPRRESEKNLMDDQSVRSGYEVEPLERLEVPEMNHADTTLQEAKLQNSSKLKVVPGVEEHKSDGLDTEQPKRASTLDTADSSASAIWETPMRSPIKDGNEKHIKFSDTNFQVSVLRPPTPPLSPNAKRFDEASYNHSSVTESFDSLSDARQSKWEKVRELININRELKGKARELQKELEAKDRKLQELEEREMVGTGQSTGEKSEDTQRHLQAILALSAATKRQNKTLDLQIEKYRRAKKEVERYQRERRHLRKGIAMKRAQVANLKKEMASNATEIGTLRKELSQALQQVDMLEEEQEQNRRDIIKLTKELSQGGVNVDLANLKEQLQYSSEDNRKKDRTISRQRIEVENQMEQITQLKAALENAHNRLERIETDSERIEELSAVNDELRFQLDQKSKEMEEAENKKMEMIAQHDSKMQTKGRQTRELEQELKQCKEKLAALHDDRSSRSLPRGQAGVNEKKLEQDIELLKSALEAATKQNESLSLENAEMQEKLLSDIDELRKESGELREEQNAAIARSHELERSCEYVSEERDRLEKTIRDLEDTLNLTQKGVESRDQDMINEIMDLRAALEETNAKAQQREEEYNLQEERLGESLDQVEAELVSVQRHNADLEVQIQAMQDEDDERNEEWRVERERWEERNATLQEEVEQLQEIAEHVEDVQDQLVVYEDDIQKLQETNDALEAHLDNLIDERDELKEIAQSAQEEVAEVRTTLASLEEIVDDYDDMQEEAEKLREQVNIVKAELEDAHAENDELRAAAEDAQRDLRSTLPIAEQSKEEMETLRREVQRLNSENEKLEREMGALADSRDDWKAAAKRMEEDLLEKRSSLEYLEDTNERLAETESEVQALHSEKESLQRKLDQVVVERNQLVGEMEHFEEQKKANAELQKSLEEKLSQSRTEVASKEALSASSKALIDSLTSEKEALEKHLEQVEADAEEARTGILALEDMVEDFEDLQDEATQLRAENGKMSQQIEHLTNERDEISSALAATGGARDRGDSEMRGSTMSTLIGRIQQDRDSWRDVAEAAKASASELQTLHAATEKELQEVSQSLEESRQQNEELTANLKQMSEERHETQQQVEKLASNLEERERKLDELQNDVEMYIERAKEADVLRNDATGLEETIKKHVVERMELLSIVMDGSRGAASEDDLREGVLAVVEQRDDLATRMNALEDKFLASCDDIEELESQLSKATREVDDLEKQCRDLETRIEDHEGLAKKKDGQVLDLEAELAGAKSALLALGAASDEADQTQQKLAAIESQIGTLTCERDYWRKVAEDAEKELETRDQVASVMKDEIRVLRRNESDVETLTESVAELELQIEDLKKERETLESLVETKELDKKQSLSSLALVQSELQTLTAEMNAHREATKQLEGRLEAVSEEREDLKASLNEARETETQSREAMMTVEGEIQKVQGEADDLYERNSVMAMELASLQLERDEWKLAAERNAAMLMSAKSMQTSQEGDATELKNRIVDLEALKVDLESRAEMMSKERDTWRDTADDAKNESLSLRATLLSVEEELTNAKSIQASQEGDVAELKNRIVDLESLKVDLESSADIVSKERDYWRDTAEEARDESLSLRAKLSSVEEELMSSQAMQASQAGDVAELKNRIIDLEELNVDLESSAEMISKERDDWRDAAEDAKHESLSLRGKLLSVEEELMSAKSMQTSQEGEVAELKNRIIDLEALKVDLESRAEMMLQERDDWRDTADDAKKESLSLRAQLLSVEEELKESLEIHHREAEDVEAEMKNLGQQHASLRIEVRDLKEERDELKSKYEEMESTAAAASTTLSSTTQELIDMRSENAELLDQVEESHAQQEKLMQERIALAATVEEHQTERIANQQALLKAQDEYDSLAEKLKTTQGDIDNVLRERDMLQEAFEKSQAHGTDNADLKAKLVEIQDECSELSRMIDMLRDDNADLESEVERLMLERDDLRSRTEDAHKDMINAHEVEVKKLNQEVMDLQERCAAAEKKLEVTPVVHVPQGSAIQDGTSDAGMAAQESLLRAAAERKQQETSKGGWGFGFTGRLSPWNEEATETPVDASDKASVAELEKVNSANQEVIQKLKSEAVQMQLRFKEESYLGKKRIETLENENSAYQLKIGVLEHELERLSKTASETPTKEEKAANLDRLDELENKLETMRREKKEAEVEIESLQADFDMLHKASEVEATRNKKDIDHLKLLIKDYEEKTTALEKMALAINQENASLREMAHARGEDDSLRSENQFRNDEKDVKIAQLHYELVNLRMQLDTIRHEDLKEEVIQLRKEKLQMRASVEKQLSAFEEENNILMEDLKMKLRAREHTIKMLERSLDVLASAGQ